MSCRATCNVGFVPVGMTSCWDGDFTEKTECVAGCAVSEVPEYGGLGTCTDHMSPGSTCEQICPRRFSLGPDRTVCTEEAELHVAECFEVAPFVDRDTLREAVIACLADDPTGFLLGCPDAVMPGSGCLGCDGSRIEAKYGSLPDWDVSQVDDMHGVFLNQRNFDGDLSRWKVGQVTSMQGMFENASAFKQPLTDWDTGRVEDMSSMFQGAETFNSDVAGWDTGEVRDMSGMFFGALLFNQDVGPWDTARVTDMSRMFRNATSFNGDVGDWVVSGVADMSEMFMHAEAFSADLGSWVLKPGVLTVDQFLGAVRFQLGYDCVDPNDGPPSSCSALDCDWPDPAPSGYASAGTCPVQSQGSPPTFLSHGGSCTPVCPSGKTLSGPTKCHAGVLTVGECGTKCAAGQVVRYGKCRTCATGQTSAAGSTARSIAYLGAPEEECVCKSNYHVSDGNCVMCPASRGNPPGDRPSGPDTGCYGWPCPENHYVSGLSCVPCPYGMVSPYGIDTKGPDTVCNMCPSNTKFSADAGVCEPCAEGLTAMPSYNGRDGCVTTLEAEDAFSSIRTYKADLMEGLVGTKFLVDPSCDHAGREGVSGACSVTVKFRTVGERIEVEAEIVS